MFKKRNALGKPEMVWTTDGIILKRYRAFNNRFLKKSIEETTHGGFL